MSAILAKRSVKEFIAFMAVLALALGFSSLFGEHALATSFISQDDNLVGGQSDLKKFVFDTIQFFLFFLGAIAVVMFIYAGILYVTSAGNDDNIGKAKNIMLYSAIGIVLIFASFAIVNTIFNAVGKGINGGSTPSAPTTTVIQ